MSGRGSFEDKIDRHRLLVCVGTGGVGKTTLAAATALAAAHRGRRAMVLTIDPARQRARSLGLSSLCAGGERIADDVFRAAGLEIAGELSAGMLDEKLSWDGFVTRHAPSAAVRDAILGNAFYQQLSTGFAGTTEYMAIEELCRLHESQRFDLIVLDTPPAAHALDFLRAPARIDHLIDPNIARWLSEPLAVGAAGSSMSKYVIKRLERATGNETLRSMSSFFGSLTSIIDGIAARSEAARRLLFHPQTAFVLVASPHEQVLAETALLLAQLRGLGVPLAGAILNRLLPAHLAPELAHDDLEKILKSFRDAGASTEVVDYVARSHQRLRARRRAETMLTARFEASLPKGVSLATVEQRPSDAHTMGDLAAIAGIGG
jgi:anion-transporting  ArsA/GET3 family ATPase